MLPDEITNAGEKNFRSKRKISLIKYNELGGKPKNKFWREIMNDGTEYAEMLKTMVSSCDVVVKPAKRRKKKDVKQDVITKVNEVEKPLEEVPAADEFTEVKSKRKWFKFRDRAVKDSSVKTEKRKFDIVYAEGIAVFVLIVAILLTNIFWENSGINVAFRRAFSSVQTTTDTRSYSSFNAQSPSDSLDSKVESGVMTFSGKGALYPVCDGTVSSIVEEDGKFTLTISHSGVFKTVISGVDFVYCNKGEEVFRYIPVCYLNGGEAKVSMYNEDVLLTNYVLENGSIVWSV